MSCNLGGYRMLIIINKYMRKENAVKIAHLN